MRDDIKCARETNIVEIARRLGMDVSMNKSLCYKGHDSAPSLSFKRDWNIYKCFGCGEHGDTIDLVRRVTGKDFKSSVEWINGSSISAVKIAERKEVDRNDASHDDIYRYILTSRHVTHVSPYMVGRGINPETCRRLGIREVLDGMGLAGDLYKRYSEEKLKESGIGDCYNSPLFSTHRVIIPYLRNKKIITLKGRDTTGGAKVKYHNLHGRPMSLYVSTLRKGVDTTFICEGEIDAVTVYQDGFSAVAVSGANNFRPEYMDIIKSSTVFLCGDNDMAGKKFNHDIKKIIGASKKVDEYEYMDGVKDINEEYCMRYNNAIQHGHGVL